MFRTYHSAQHTFVLPYDHRVIERLLGLLGDDFVAPNVSRLYVSADSSHLEVTVVIPYVTGDVCEDLATMREAVFRHFYTVKPWAELKASDCGTKPVGTL